MSNDEAGLVFAALADPTRREIFLRLIEAETSTATLLAADVDVTRQAVTKHLLILADSNLASSEKVGRETQFRANIDQLDSARSWIDQVESDWTKRLGLLAKSLDKGTNER